MPENDVQGRIEKNAINNEQENYKNIQKRRNIANNSENAKKIADVASKSANPYAKAAGTAVKVADKLTGGKASDAIGKKMAKLSSLSPQGKALQKASNKIAEGGTSSRIENATNKKNSKPGLLKPAESLNSNVPGKENNLLNRKEVEDETTDGGDGGFRATANFIKISLIASIPIFVTIIFINLLTSSSSVIQFSIGIGNADNTSDANMENKINNANTDKMEGKEDLEAFNYDIFIDDNNSKLRNIKLKQVAKIKSKTRLYNEADIAQIEDYYSGFMNTEDYDMDMVYTFFFRLNRLYLYYTKHYNVELDMPLLMSTLSVNTDDLSEVFKANTIGYGEEEIQELKNPDLKYDLERFSYENTFNYTSTPTKGEYDMELLAQHMVSKVPYDANDPLCDDPVDNYCYVIDTEQYDEFLKEFLEKKYYLGGFNVTAENSVQDNASLNSDACVSKSFIKYNLTEDQIRQLASLAYHEQGTVKGAAAEASLMANLFELKGSKYGSGADGLYNYVRNSGWFANSVANMDSREASSEIVNVVRKVLVDGKRTIPGYIDEHDWINDISSATTNGKSISIKDRASYIKNNTKLKNIYGATYTFYSFPDVNSDPFGYSSDKRREEIGEFHYDVDTWEPISCESLGSDSNNPYAKAFINLAIKELESNKGQGGNKYNSYFGYSSNTAWCANFASYLIRNTTVNGVPMYPNIIDFTSASAGTLIKNFNNSNKSNIKFYYNDSCSNLKSKNGQGTYTPKPGDLIFFDWEAKYFDISSNTQDHVGIVEKYLNGTIYTIEGNSGRPGRIKRQKYSISDCRVVGYGSWY